MHGVHVLVVPLSRDFRLSRPFLLYTERGMLLQPTSVNKGWSTSIPKEGRQLSNDDPAVLQRINRGTRRGRYDGIRVLSRGNDLYSTT